MILSEILVCIEKGFGINFSTYWSLMFENEQVFEISRHFVNFSGLTVTKIIKQLKTWLGLIDMKTR